MRTRTNRSTGQREWLIATPKQKSTHGGRRKGAGRKAAPGSRDRGHHARKDFDPRHPQHVVLRVRRDIGRLRRWPIFQAVQSAARAVLDHAEFRLVHFSIQHNHLHLIVEASSKAALSKGMNTLAGAIGRAINASLGRTGKVFECRYHATAITAPRQARNALAYVLNNWRRHNEDERSIESRFAPLDPYSTAMMFDGWKEQGRVELPDYLIASPVRPPSSWLLRDGWRKAKRPISMFATPGLDERP